MFKGLVRKTIPLVAFGVGIAGFPRDWRAGHPQDTKLLHINEEVLRQIQSTKEYKQLESNKSLRQYNSSNAFPGQHHNNYVGTGLLFGPDLFEIDPINQAPPQSTVVLRAKVKEAKGRKVVIGGYLETLPLDDNKAEKPLLIAESTCILVQPKWFKYFTWLQI
ncbi:uncharacterized protein J8A68_000553 [[Candida] subhashii]|uniref:Uncharacterized protein n=1 Tax=[Candida] subhashii TaxID=561895 RepID=A0A8J5V1K6_9ASCO|nr:uncharacterized protein J8A68_000553 [[Candida] subhashii]KAG7665930.1 hypothetical protein J8A68_000553 [[Candida] subhashii]